MSSRALRRLGLETSQASNKIPSTTTSILVPSSGKNCPSASDEEILHEEIQAHVIPKGNTFALVCPVHLYNILNTSILILNDSLFYDYLLIFL